MRVPRSTRWAGGRATFVAAALVLGGCARSPQRERHVVQDDCDFVVLNRTSHVLEIRVGIRPMSTMVVGALNPGELLNHSAPCAEQGVWIEGIPIPDQVGAPLLFAVVQRWAELAAGDRVEVSLYWP